MPQEEKKFYPFSGTSVPDEYDGFLLLNKEQGYKHVYETNDGKQETFIGKISFQGNAITPEQNSAGNFKCIINVSNVHNHMYLCHVFTIIDKDEEVVGNWKDKCPTSLNELRPLSLKGRGLIDTNYKASFPKIFLVAIKWKNTNTAYEWFGPEGKKKVENISQVLLSFPKESNSNYPIFSWANTTAGESVFCNKDLLNIKKLN